MYLSFVYCAYFISLLYVSIISPLVSFISPQTLAILFVFFGPKLAEEAQFVIATSSSYPPLVNNTTPNIRATRHVKLPRVHRARYATLCSASYSSSAGGGKLKILYFFVSLVLLPWSLTTCLTNCTSIYTLTHLNL